jgi:hypothetical protein
MRRLASSLIDTLVSEEIRRMVAEAIKNGRSLSACACAAEIVKVYPRCGLDEADLANDVMMAAARAGVPVEIGKSRRAAGGLDEPPKVVVETKRQAPRSAA